MQKNTAPTSQGIHSTRALGGNAIMTITSFLYPFPPCQPPPQLAAEQQAVTNSSNLLNSPRKMHGKKLQVEVRLYELPNANSHRGTPVRLSRLSKLLAEQQHGVSDCITKSSCCQIKSTWLTGSTFRPILVCKIHLFYLGNDGGERPWEFIRQFLQLHSFHFKPDGSTDLNPSSAQTGTSVLPICHDALQGTTGCQPTLSPSD